MKNKRLLSMEDLYNYYSSQKKSVHFSSKDDDKNIVVQVKGSISFEKDTEKNIEGLLPVTLMACHIDENLNKSEIPEKVMTAAMPSFSNRPILGFIHEVNGEHQFYTHNLHINNEDEVEYDEIPIGIVRENCNPRYQEMNNKKYCVVDGYIFENYTKAADIIRREKTCDVSVELEIRELSFNAQTKNLVIEDFFFSGVTILGVDEEGNKINPGMEGANITISDFSRENNSLFSQNDKVIKLLSELNEKIDGLNIELNFTRKEENPETMFEKLLEQYGKSIDEIDFEYEGLSDEELEVVFAEHFTPSMENFEDSPKKRKSEDDDDSVVVDDDDDDQDDDKDDDDKGDDDKDDQDDDDKDDTPEVQSEEEQSEEEPENPEDVDYYSVSVTHGDITKNYSITLQDRIEALQILVNDTYSENDNELYDVLVYDDTKEIVMRGWFTGKAYRQSYKIKKNNYSLVGERVFVKAVYVTEDEEKALDAMKANYSSIEEKLQQYESEPEKLEVLASEEYSQIKDTDAYKELTKRDTYFSMSKDELVEKLDACLLEFAKHNKIEFSATEPEKKSVGIKKFSNPDKRATKGSSRYGGLFRK